MLVRPKVSELYNKRLISSSGYYNFLYIVVPGPGYMKETSGYYMLCPDPLPPTRVRALFDPRVGAISHETEV